MRLFKQGYKMKPKYLSLLLLALVSLFIPLYLEAKEPYEEYRINYINYYLYKGEAYIGGYDVRDWDAIEYDKAKDPFGDESEVEEFTVPEDILWTDGKRYPVVGFFQKSSNYKGYISITPEYCFPPTLNLPSTLTKALSVYLEWNGNVFDVKEIKILSLVEFLKYRKWDESYSKQERERNQRINIATGGIYSSYDGAIYSDSGSRLAFVPLNRKGILKISPDATTIDYEVLKNHQDITEVLQLDNIEYIKGKAFENCQNLQSITLGNKLKSIDAEAFPDCKKLTEVKAVQGYDPSNVNGSVGGNIFNGCTKLKSVEFPGNIKAMSIQVFAGCRSIEHVSLPDAMTIIPSGMFDNCSHLKTLQLPGCLTMVNPLDFVKFNNLEFIVPEDAKTIEGLDGMVYTKGLWKLILSPTDIDKYEAPAATREIGESVFENHTSLSEVNLNKVETIGDYAFRNSTSLESVTAGGNLLKIGDSAFKDCANLTSFTASNSGELISGYGKMEASAFSGCSLLTVMQLPRLLQVVEPSAFYGCTSLKEFLVPADAPYIEVRDGLVYSKGLERLMLAPYKTSSLTLPDVTREVCDNVFDKNDYLRYITFNEGLEKIGVASFRDCPKLVEITLPESVTELGNECFALSDGTAHNSALRTVKLPAGLQKIANESFRNNGIKSITFSDGLEFIGKEAFCNVVWDEGVDLMLPVTLREISDYGFGGNSCKIGKLSFGTLRKIGQSGFTGVVPEEIMCGVWTPPELYNYGFSEEAFTHSVLNVPTGSEELHYDAPGWRKFVNIKSVEYSGVENVSMTDEVEVKTIGENLIIKVPGKMAVEVYNSSGQRVCETHGSCNLTPGKGIYIVKTGKSAHKVIL